MLWDRNGVIEIIVCQIKESMDKKTSAGGGGF